ASPTPSAPLAAPPTALPSPTGAVSTPVATFAPAATARATAVPTPPHEPASPVPARTPIPPGELTSAGSGGTPKTGGGSVPAGALLLWFACATGALATLIRSAPVAQLERAADF